MRSSAGYAIGCLHGHCSVFFAGQTVDRVSCLFGVQLVTMCHVCGGLCVRSVAKVRAAASTLRADMCAVHKHSPHLSGSRVCTLLEPSLAGQNRPAGPCGIRTGCMTSYSASFALMRMRARHRATASRPTQKTLAAHAPAPRFDEKKPTLPFVMLTGPLPTSCPDQSACVSRYTARSLITPSLHTSVEVNK